jgi:ubiquinone/menaquinone biosynthesis C-methylase UbiE
MKAIIEWIDRQKGGEIYTSTYWNNIEVEKGKEWWLTDKNDKKLVNYLHSSGLFEEYKLAQTKLEEKSLLHGNILDVAAGVCWTSALLSRCEQIKRIDALDFSWHRINQLAPVVCEHFEANRDKIQRIFGTFYDIKKGNDEYDLIFMSQAFHHADNPVQLLVECNRVLKSGGCVALVGEHLITPYMLLKRAIKHFILTRKISINFYELVKPDEISGDHYYRIDDYYFLFQSFGYTVKHYKTNIRNSLVIIATKDR